MLFRRDSGHRLKPVCEMGRSLFNRPILHRIRNHICHRIVQPLSYFHRTLQLLIRLFRKPLPHHRIIENIRSKNSCDRIHKHLSLTPKPFRKMPTLEKMAAKTAEFLLRRLCRHLLFPM